MKLYQKTINNNNVIKSRKEIVVIKDGKQYINPTEETLLSDGWEIYTPVIIEKSEEELALERFNLEKNNIISEIKRYDTSEDVNLFYVNDIPVWLDKETRTGLVLRFNSELAKGKTSTTLWYNGMKFSLLIENAINMLYDIENYASECYDNTQQHLSNVDKLTTIEELIEYDYRKGYPEKLRF